MLIRAPESEGGKMGSCPHCKGRNYVPMFDADAGEIPIVPLDEAEERRRARAAAEDAAIQMRLLRERERDRDVAKPAVRRADGPSPAAASSTASQSTGQPTGASRKQLTGLIVTYIEAMSTGKLEKAESVATQLADDRRTVASIIDEMLTEDLTTYGMPSLPKPVLVGFIKQLRGRM